MIITQVAPYLSQTVSSRSEGRKTFFGSGGQMDDTMTTIYCLCEEFLKATGHRDDPQAYLSTAEVMTVALSAATFFGGNVDRSRLFLHEHGYMPTMISESRLNRRLHSIPQPLWRTLFDLLAATSKESEASQEYVVDSLPIPVCDNIRIWRCRLSMRASAFGVTSPLKSATSMACGCT
jgi:hypothetical protein